MERQLYLAVALLPRHALLHDAVHADHRVGRAEALPVSQGAHALLGRMVDAAHAPRQWPIAARGRSDPVLSMQAARAAE